MLDTAAGMVVTRIVGRFVIPQAAIWIGGLLLIALGAYRFLIEFLDRGRSYGIGVAGRRLVFSIGQLVVTVVVKPATVGIGQTRNLAPAEAMLLGLALSIDNVMVVAALNLSGRLPLYTPVVMGVMQLALFAAGWYGLALLLEGHLKRSLPYASAATLVVLGLLRLL